MMRKSCNNLKEVADVFNHNTKCFDSAIKQAGKRIRRMEKKHRSLMMGSFLFGVVVEICLMAENQKIAELEEKVNVLYEEIRELRDREGDS